MVGADTPRGEVLILATVGRDAPAVAVLMEKAGLRPVVCKTLQHVVDNLGAVRAQFSCSGRMGAGSAAVVGSAFYHTDKPERGSEIRDIPPRVSFAPAKCRIS